MLDILDIDIAVHNAQPIGFDLKTNSLPTLRLLTGPSLWGIDVMPDCCDTYAGGWSSSCRCGQTDLAVPAAWRFMETVPNHPTAEDFLQSWAPRHADPLHTALVISALADRINELRDSFYAITDLNETAVEDADSSYISIQDLLLDLAIANCGPLA